MRAYWLVAVGLLFCCCNDIYHAAGGEVFTESRNDISLATYKNELSDFYSQITHEVSYMGTKAGRVKLPLAYKKALLKSASDGKKELLYTAVVTNRKGYKPAYLVATIVRSSGVTRKNLFEVVDMSALKNVSNYSIRWVRLQNGELILRYHYSLLRGKRRAYDVISLHTIWTDGSIICISIVKPCDRKIFDTYTRIHHLSNLFQHIPPAEDKT